MLSLAVGCCSCNVTVAGRNIASAQMSPVSKEGREGLLNGGRGERGLVIDPSLPSQPSLRTTEWQKSQRKGESG